MKKRSLLVRILLCCIGIQTLCSCAMFKENWSYQVRELVPDGAWTWFNDERVIIDGQMLLIGSLDSSGTARVDLFDMQNHTRTDYPLSSWQSVDDHNNPALLKMSNGNILVCYAQHHRQKQWYWRTAAVEDNNDHPALEWSPEHIFQVPAATTYCNLIQLADENNRIYNFSRNMGFNPNLQYSDDNAQSWQGPFVLIQSGDNRTRPYVKYADNGKDRIDFLYTDGHPRNEPTNNVYHLYYQKDGFYRTDGTLIKTIDQLKEEPMVPTDGTLIYDGRTDGPGWVWDIEYDKDGNPVAAFINSVDHAEGNDLRYRYARWNPVARQWTQRQIAFAGTHLYVPENHYAGGIAIDPQDADTVYISCDVEPESGKPNVSGRYQIYQGKTVDRGNTWQWRQLTFNTGVDNLRPVVPRHQNRSMCVIWLQGQYKTYTDFKTKIVGIIEK